MTFSMLFPVSGKDQSGSCFELVISESQSEGFLCPLMNTASAIHRLLFAAKGPLLSTIIQTDTNSLLAIFFNLPSSITSDLCDYVIANLHSSLSIVKIEKEFQYDLSLLKMAYEGLIIRTLENLNWLLVNYSNQLELYNSLGMRITNLIIKSENLLQPISKNHNSNFNLIFSGNLSYQKLNEFCLEDRKQMKKYQNEGRIILDHHPCRVLPKFSKAYAVELIRVSDFADQEDLRNEVYGLLNYWKVVHGIELNNNINEIVKVVFSNSEQIFTYPIECVTSQNPFVHENIKQSKSQIIQELNKRIQEIFQMI